jgi:L-lactate dehydrogenase complex protein LldG
MERPQILDRFVASLDRLEVGWSRVSETGVAAALEDLVEGPAVGTPLSVLDEGALEALGVEVAPTLRQIAAARTGVTAARLGIADYGSVVIEGGPDATEAASLFPERHIAVLRTADVVPDMPAAFERLGPLLREEATTAILATGPSATADMGALVKGAHGPKAVHVVLVDAD